MSTLFVCILTFLAGIAIGRRASLESKPDTVRIPTQIPQPPQVADSKRFIVSPNGSAQVEFLSSDRSLSVSVAVESSIPVYAYVVDADGLSDYRLGKTFNALAGYNESKYNCTLRAYVLKKTKIFLLVVNSDASDAEVTWEQT